MPNTHDTAPSFVETQEGDVIVPPNAVDALGWQPEFTFDGYEWPLRSAGRAALQQQGIKPPEELTNPGTIERLATIHEQLGFYPTSLDELSRSHTILGFRDKAGGAAKHIAEVVTHQSKESVNTDDPMAAARSITNNFLAYARRARADKTALLELQTELAQSNASRLAGVNALATTGRGQLVRYLDIARLAEKGEGADVLADTTVKPGFDPYIATNPERQVREHISAVLARKRLGEVLQGLPAVIKDQAARQTFWMQCLMDVAQHYPALRTQATEAIRHLGQPQEVDE